MVSVRIGLSRRVAETDHLSFDDEANAYDYEVSYYGERTWCSEADLEHVAPPKRNAQLERTGASDGRRADGRGRVVHGDARRRPGDVADRTGPSGATRLL